MVETTVGRVICDGLMKSLGDVAYPERLEKHS